jgi:hypothetical protein
VQVALRTPGNSRRYIFNAVVFHNFAEGAGLVFAVYQAEQIFFVRSLLSSLTGWFKARFFNNFFYKGIRPHSQLYTVFKNEASQKLHIQYLSVQALKAVVKKPPGGRDRVNAVRNATANLDVT